MNRILLASSVLFVVLCGCTNQAQPVRITRLYPLQGCSISEKDKGDLIAGSASVDVAAGAPQVLVGVEATGPLYTNNGLALRTGEQLEPKSANFPVFTDVILTYRLSRRLGATPKVYDVPLGAPTAPATQGATDLKLNLAVQLISPELGELLTNGLTGSTTYDDFVDIDVDIELRGEINVTRTPVSTGIVTFPIRAVKSAPSTTCAAGQRFTRYPFKNSLGGVDFCRYVGSSFDPSLSMEPPFNAYYLFPIPAPPSLCCDPTLGTPGC